MKTTEFCYWLQGGLELNNNQTLDEKQTQIVKNHLNMVFEHIAHLKEEDQPPVKHSPNSFGMTYGKERC